MKSATMKFVILLLTLLTFGVLQATADSIGTEVSSNPTILGSHLADATSTTTASSSAGSDGKDNQGFMSKHKKWFIIGAIILVLILVGLGVFFFVIKQ